MADVQRIMFVVVSNVRQGVRHVRTSKTHGVSVINRNSNFMHKTREIFGA